MMPKTPEKTKVPIPQLNSFKEKKDVSQVDLEQLKQICRENDIQNFSTLGKSQIVEIIWGEVQKQPNSQSKKRTIDKVDSDTSLSDSQENKRPKPNPQEVPPIKTTNKSEKVQTPEIKTSVDSKIVKKSDEEKIFTGTQSVSQRNTFQIRFWESLKKSTQYGYDQTTALAIKIEEELYAEYSGTKEYAQKFRSLVTNLKDPLNEQLREALFSGAILPSELVQMSNEDLANPNIKEKRKKIIKDSTEALQGVKPPVSSLFQCNRCKESKTSYRQLQTRSADEPMTTFVNCQLRVYSKSKNLNQYKFTSKNLCDS